MSFWSTRHLHVELGRATHMEETLFSCFSLSTTCKDIQIPVEPIAWIPHRSPSQAAALSLWLFSKSSCYGATGLAIPMTIKSPTPLQELGKRYAGIQLTNDSKGKEQRFSLVFTHICFSHLSHAGCHCPLHLSHKTGAHRR